MYLQTRAPSEALRKHAYLNILGILPPKNENFQMKNSGRFHISAQNMDCGYLLEPPRRGGSNEFPQSMFLRKNKKINVYPNKPQFYCIQEAHGPRVAHLSDIATADMQMLCNIFPILSLQLMKRSSFKQFLILEKNIIYGMTVNGA